MSRLVDLFLFAMARFAYASVGKGVDGAAVDRLGGDVGLGGNRLLVLHAAAHLDALKHVGDHLGAPRHCLIII